MPTLHIGKKRVQTITTSDGSTLAPGAVSALAPDGGVGITVDPDTNAVTVTAGPNPGPYNVSYSATGYGSVQETFTVLPAPTLIVTDGPEQ